MPFIDLDTHKFNFNNGDFDVTIIGAGAAGILTAIKLSKAGKKVLLIESGNFKESDSKQSLNEVIQTGKNLENVVWGRKRVLGGTTTAWGGQSLPFTPFDFTKKAWIPLSGWPICYDDLKEYYDEANTFMEIDILNYKEEIFPKIKLSPPEFDKSSLNFHVAKWASIPNFLTLYYTFLNKNVTVVYNAQLISIQKNHQSIIDQIEISNFKLETFKFNPIKLILTSGTIESIRQLLINNLVSEPSLHWLGKCFMDHPCIEIGEIEPNNEYEIQKLFNTHIWKGRKYSIRLSFSDDIQEKLNLLNCSAGIMFMPKSGNDDVYLEVKQFLKDFKFNRLGVIIGSSGKLIKSLYAYLFDRFYFKVDASGKFKLMIEQEPLEESNLILSESKDRFGLPKLVLNWNISKKTWESAIKMSELLISEFNRLELGNVKLYDHLKADNINWADCLTDVNHHIGGARMGATEKDGIVNSDLKVWGIENLFVCSCAVFPTSSHSNPTLTLLALAARLGNHILKK